MDRADIRAPRASLKMWRARAKASGMTFSEWARHGLDATPIYSKPEPTPVTATDEGNPKP